MFKVNNRSTKTRYEIRSKLRGKTVEQYHRRCPGALIVNFLINVNVLNFTVLIVNFEHEMPVGIVKICL